MGRHRHALANFLAVGALAAMAGCGPGNDRVALATLRNGSLDVAAIEVGGAADSRRLVALALDEQLRFDVRGNGDIELRAIDRNGRTIGRGTVDADLIRRRGIVARDGADGGVEFVELADSRQGPRWETPRVIQAFADEADPIGLPSHAFDAERRTFWRSLTPPATTVTLVGDFESDRLIHSVRVAPVCTGCGPVRLHVALIPGTVRAPSGLASPGAPRSIAIDVAALRASVPGTTTFEIVGVAADGRWIGARVPEGPVSARAIAITIVEAPENIGFYEVALLAAPP